MYPTGSHAPPEKGGHYPPPQGGYGGYPPPSGGAYPPPPGGAPGYPGGYGPPPGGYGPPPGGYGGPSSGGYGPPPGGYGGHPGGYGPPPGTGPVGPPPGGYAPPPMGNMGHMGPIYNPPMPFRGRVPGGVVPGRSIIIKGMVTADDRFSVNLKCGDEYGLHFNPRPSQGCVVLNHNQNGWGPEERHDGSMFQPGQHFELCIHVEPNQYLVFINQQPNPNITFAARLYPIEKYDELHIDGSVQISEIKFA
ncbi:galectin-5-like [Saccostrea cucullata]|uniref:galectin-5-like n=1 Tax=Saccostrea cuccullata TaxID=36930 RepID=UPI002ED048D6